MRTFDVAKVYEANNKEGTRRCYAKTIFDPDLIARFRNLRGQWLAGPRQWVFDVRDTERVREACKEVLGVAGDVDEELELVSLRVDLDKVENAQEIWIGSRRCLYRPGRDVPVRLGEGVIILSGGFPQKWGGSVNNPRVQADAGTVIEVRDLPRVQAERELARLPAAMTLVEYPPQESGS